MSHAIRRTVAVLTAVAALAALPAAAQAGKHRDLTGNYTGTTEQPPFSFTEDFEPYTDKIVLQVLRGRLIGLYTTIRMECPEISILDRHPSSLPRKGLALKDHGSFHFSEDGISISGSIRRHSASGSMSGHVDGCMMSGVSWEAKRVKGV